MKPTTLTMVDGVRVVVPDSLNLITPYVLQEQQDWFEDEIKFLRHLLKPGQKIIDIGANYGVYALSMAQTVGPAGHVWCFEPASSTATFLAQGIAANGFAHVTLEKSALSSQAGTARLSLHDNAELNELVRGGDTASAAAGATEEVPLTTLDACLDRFGWQDIDFMKIDAEGEETNILKGGQRFFATLSPLVEYEVKAGNALHLDLIRQFADLGYHSYRLVPGLQLLVPFSADETPDGYLLNLFCCKEDGARRLAARGLLADPALTPGATGAALDTLAAAPACQWIATVGTLPYGKALLPHWQQTMAVGGAAGNSAEVAAILALHALAHDPAQPATTRFNALQSGLDRARRLIATDGSGMRLATFARLAAEYGARGQAVQALNHLAAALTRDGRLSPGEPFLPPGAAFGQVDPGTAMGNWVLSAVLEELERQSAFSSFYTGPAARQRLEVLASLGFASPEMLRRLTLLRRRFG